MTILVTGPADVERAPIGATWIVDNYDSFTWNLVQLVGALGVRPVVVRNDAASADAIRARRPARLLLSPGPGHPDDPARVGVCTALVRELGRAIPVLGVCLGHQLIVSMAGGRIVRAPRPVHGKPSLVRRDGGRLFEGLPPSFEAMRYHSLVADPARVPSTLRVTSWSEDGVIMSVEHVERPVFGLQFHPESIGTPLGRTLLSNFLTLPEIHEPRDDRPLFP